MHLLQDHCWSGANKSCVNKSGAYKNGANKSTAGVVLIRFLGHNHLFPGGSFNSYFPEDPSTAFLFLPTAHFPLLGGVTGVSQRFLCPGLGITISAGLRLHQPSVPLTGGHPRVIPKPTTNLQNNQCFPLQNPPSSG